MFLNTLGVAQYRNGLLVEALATLTRSNELNKGQEPSDLALLALTQHRLGQTEAARTTLGRLRELMKTPKAAQDPEAPGFLREAETIELDRAFPGANASIEFSPAFSHRMTSLPSRRILR